MNRLVFQRFQKAERVRSLQDELNIPDATFIVFSPNARELAAAERSRNPGTRQIINLLFDDQSADSFNPLDIFRYIPEEKNEEAVSALFESFRKDSKDNFGPDLPSGVLSEPSWRILADEVVENMIRLHLLRKKSNPSLTELVNYFFNDDIDTALNQLLQGKSKIIPPNISSVIASVIKRSPEHKSAIFALAQATLSFLNNDLVQAATWRTTFEPEKIINSGAIIFIEFPLSTLSDCHTLNRLWLSAFICLAAYTRKVDQKVSIIVDNNVESDLFLQLLLALKLRNPVGISFYCDNLDQLQIQYPAQWSAFVGNFQTVEARGPISVSAANGLSTIFGVAKDELLKLAPNSLMSLVNHAGPSASPILTNTNVAQAGQHTITFASGYANKWNFLAELMIKSPERSVIVVESAGKCYDLTHQLRSKSGRVIKLDPFHVLGNETDKLNPLDLFTNTIDGIYRFAEILVETSGISAVDPFWRNHSLTLIRSVLQYLTSIPEKQKTLGELWNTFHNDDVIYNLAVVLDTLKKQLPRDCYSGMAIFLQHAEILRARILQEVTKIITIFSSTVVQQAVASTSFDPSCILENGTTIYLEIPSHLWSTHGLLIRLWLSALLNPTGLSKSSRPALLLADNAFELKLFPILQNAQHSASVGIDCWSFWESVEQLETGHPGYWRSFISSCQTIQAFGPQNPAVAKGISNLFGTSYDKLITLKPEQICLLYGSTSAVTAESKEKPNLNNKGHRVSFASCFTHKWTPERVESITQKEGVVIVVESTGECFSYSKKAREQKGPVILLDPFHITDSVSGQYNPLDLLRMDKQFLGENALYLTELLYVSDPSSIDPFWRINTIRLLRGILLYFASIEEKSCDLVELRDYLISDDVVYNLAVVLDTLKNDIPSEAYNFIARFLEKAETERSGVVATAFGILSIFDSPSIAHSVRKTSFDIRAILKGDPFTIYIEMPADMLQTHSLLIKLWVGSLLNLFRSARPENTPCFIIDSIFSTELFPLLSWAQCSPNAEVWTFWETLAQLKSNHPAQWSAFLANASFIELISSKNPVIINDLAAAFGKSRAEIQAIPEGESIVLYEAGSRT